MKEALILIILSFFFGIACNKEFEDANTKLNSQIDLESRSKDKINTSHFQGKGNFRPMEVMPNAFAAHLAHGDYLPDADGDGYTAIGSCSGSMNDCGDTNVNVNPGETEICVNGLDDDCSEMTPDVCCTTTGLLRVTLPGGHPLCASHG